MRNIVKMGALLLLIMALPACTTTRQYNLIDPEARALLRNVDSVLISKQTSLDADIEVSRISSYVQGHFVPVLIDIGLNSLRSRKANKLLSPINETLIEYDFTEDIHSEFNQALQESGIAGIDKIDLMREEKRGFKIAYLQKSNADAVMFIDVKYAFSPGFEALNLSSQVLMMPVNEALSPYKEIPDTDDIIELGDNIYRNQFRAAISPPAMIGTKSENGALWAQMPDQELSRRLQDAAKKLAKAIAQDLSLDDIDEDAAKAETENGQTQSTEAPSSEPSDTAMTGPEVEETPELTSEKS